MPPSFTRGTTAIATISHMCMEPHGSHCEFMPDGKLIVHLSTQNVSGTAGGFAEGLGLDASNVTVVCNYVGGGFGSKFAADEWGLACASSRNRPDSPCVSCSTGPPNSRLPAFGRRALPM